MLIYSSVVCLILLAISSAAPSAYSKKLICKRRSFRLTSVSYTHLDVYKRQGENLAIIEHTDVDERLKGQGIGKQLVAKVVEKMRREKRKIIPLGPCAKHEFDKTREYDDIRS